MFSSKEFEAHCQAIQACRACTNLPLGPQPIVQLSLSAKILIASQAPGQIAHNSGIPFQDPSGRNLRRWMGLDEEAFYDRERVNILPMAFCYPGKAKGGDAPPPSLCAQLWREVTLSTLTELALILIIGRHSLHWHAPHLKGQTLKTLVRDQPLLGPSPAYIKGLKTRAKAFILPHPSPRTTPWLKTNPWFETETLARLRREIKRAMP